MRALHGEWVGGQATQFVELAVPVEQRAAFKQFGEDPVPFETLFVAPVRVDGHAMHVELVLVPPAHDIESGPSVRHMVDGRDRFRDECRRDQGDMNRREEADPFGGGPDGGAVSQRLERAPEIVRLAAQSTPLCHRKDEVDPGFVGHDRRLHHVVPLACPTFRCFADREAAVTIGIEQAEFEFVRAQYRILHTVHYRLRQ